MIGLALGMAAPSAGGQTVKILTPNDDSCDKFVAAMNAGDPTKVLALGGWAVGFLSGVAEGSNIDILRPMNVQEAMALLYSSCQQQPGRLMSEVLEDMAASLIAKRRGH